MPDIIHLLPDTVANQIAAGEVIQRPSSVIKELVENSVDAGARHIDVLVVDAGRTSIQVIDDGKGMSETDARLAFERHATSKIRQASDLFTLATMGFRGEALPSIAAVAMVTLRTHSEDSELGTVLTIEGGAITSQEVDGCAVGSNFQVQNLFYNVPARRRFLKSNQTELANIMQEYVRIALVNPNVSFTLTHNGNVLSSLPAETNLRQRIATVIGKRNGDQLLAVDVDTTLCRLSGFVGKPESARKRGANQYFFVNGRFMKHPYFHKAVQEAFDKLVQPSEQVSYFLYFEVDPATIDVNIHPTKTEIKFENETAIWQIIIAAIKEALGRYNAVPTLEFDVDGRPDDIPVYKPDVNASISVNAPNTSAKPDYNPFRNLTAHQGAAPINWDSMYSNLPKAASYGEFVPEKEVGVETSSVQTTLYSDEVSLSEMERSAQHYHYRGQYIVTTVRSGLMLIDQHRAHMRVLYDRYKAEMVGKPGATQGLLFPEMVQVSLSDVPLVEEVQDELRALGFDFSSLGGGSFSVNGVPAGIDGLSPQQLFNDMISILRDTGQGIEEELHHRIALALARNAAIPSGQALSQAEMENLVASLFLSSSPNYGPDGKPIIAVLEHENIEKMFK